MATADTLSTVSVPRPREPCTLGRPVQVQTNHLAIVGLPRGNISQYHVEIDPQPARPAGFRAIWMRLQPQFAQYWLIYDGRAAAYAPKPLPHTTMTFRLVEEGRRGPAPQEPQGEVAGLSEQATGAGGAPPGQRITTMTLKKVAEIDFAVLAPFLAGNRSVSNAMLVAGAVLEILFNHHPAQTAGITTVARRSFFPRPERPFDLGGGLDLWCGLFSSARAGQGVMSLNVDTAYTAMYRNQPVPRLVADFTGIPDRALRAQELPHNTRRELARLLKGLQVELTHRRRGPPGAPPAGGGRSGGAPRSIIQGITDFSAHLQTFPLDDHVVTVEKYFAEHYNMRLEYPHLPCVTVGQASRQVFLPMEVCVIVQGQRKRGRLSPNQMASVIKEAAKKPMERMQTIGRLLNVTGMIANPTLAAWGVQVDNQFITLQGRALDTPRLAYGDRGRQREVVPDGGAWNLRDTHVQQGVKLRSAALVIMHERRDRPYAPHDAKNFLRELAGQAGRMGVEFEFDPQRIPILTRGDALSVRDAMAGACDRAGAEFAQMPQILFVILPDKDTRRYAEVKRVGDTQLGVPTQAVQADKVRGRIAPQYLANVLLKVNVKALPLGFAGRNVILKHRHPFLSVPAIILGMDVTHPAPGSNAHSIAAIVGSIDPHAVTYTTEVDVQPPRQEEVVNLGPMVRRLLERFHHQNHVFPQRMLVYRDGVSDGEFEHVRNREVTAIKEAAKELGIALKLTFIVVKKRHHTRFFPLNRQDGDKSGNFRSGLVVDRVITHPTDFDFFLQSQAGLQGTSRPAHYSVLHDDLGWTANALCRLTYDLCYTFCRATRAVGVPPPVYHAHLACMRARQYLTGSAEESLGTEEGEGAGASAAAHPNMQNSMYFM